MGGAQTHTRRSSKDGDKGYTRKAQKRGGKRTGFGDEVHGTVVVVRDTDRRGARDCGKRRRDTGKDVDEESELCDGFRERVGPELSPAAADEESVGVPPG